MPQQPKKTIEMLVEHLIEEKDVLKKTLYQYGDHTIACHAASTPRCICGWERRRRDLNIRPRPDEI